LGEEIFSIAMIRTMVPEEGVGYAAHIGGMLGGALFFLLELLI
jgi:membrane associated rhomboid family serine protease